MLLMRRGTELTGRLLALLLLVCGDVPATAQDEDLPAPIVRKLGQKGAPPLPPHTTPRPTPVATAIPACVAANNEDLPAPLVRNPGAASDSATQPPAQAPTVQRPELGSGASPVESPADGAEEEDWGDGSWDEAWDEGTETWDEDDSTSRLFIYREAVLSTYYSARGLRGLPTTDMSPDHWGLSPRPPGSYVGIDVIHTVSPSAPINRIFLPSGLPLTAIDLHPRLVFDPMEATEGLRQIEFAPQDFWFRFNPGRIDRLSLRLGQFVLPYGVNPVLAPRQRFILPLEAIDLGLKWDWGLALKGPIGEYDWEIAATIGSGEGLHSPHLFESDDRSSYLLTGRVGAPTYWDFQYGASFLYGDLPTMRGPRVMSPHSISRWRLGLDAFYKAGTFLMAGAQVTYGEDGHGDDAEFVMITGGETAQVFGYRFWVDWVVPSHQDLRLSAQLESVARDVGRDGANDAAMTFEANYSLTDSISLMLDYRNDFQRTMGEPDHAFFLTFVYYGE